MGVRNTEVERPVRDGVAGWGSQGWAGMHGSETKRNKVNPEGEREQWSPSPAWFPPAVILIPLILGLMSHL